MPIVLNAFSAVLTVFSVGLLGYLFRRRGMVSDELTRTIPKVFTTVIVPPFLLRNITSTFAHDQLVELVSGSLLPFMSIFFCFGLGMAAARLCGIAPHRRGVFSVAFSTSNCMNIGLPITIALYGEVAVPYALLYFFANVTFFWTVGNYMLACDGNRGQTRILSLDTVRRIFSPPLLGFLAGLMLVMLDIRLPVFLDKACKYVGDMAVATGLVYVGIMLADVRPGDFRLERDILLALIGRIVISPLSIFAIACLAVPPQMMRDVFVIQASLPVMLNLAVLSGYYGADSRYATVLVSISTLMAIGTIPLWAIILGHI